MKKTLASTVLAVAAVLLLAPAGWAQMTQVKGMAKDAQGNPIVGAMVQMICHENGRKYELKTGKKGDFFSLGIGLGTYRVNLLKDGQQIFFLDNVPVTLNGDNVIDLDLAKQQAAAASQMTEAQKAALKRQEEAIKENTKIQGLNDKLAAAKAAEDAGNPDQAVAILSEAVQMDATRDILWARLADTERSAGAKAADAAARTKYYQDAVESYQKAIAIKPLGPYYNNMGEALNKLGKVDEAVQAYNQAVQIDPTQTGMYYFNLGAVLTNRGKIDEANAAFDKAIAAEPTRAEAYYQKGLNLMNRATADASGKFTAPPGTSEAFQKYLEVSPSGPNAETAKLMLQQLGSTVETSFGKPKATKKKP